VAPVVVEPIKEPEPEAKKVEYLPPMRSKTGKCEPALLSPFQLLASNPLGDVKQNEPEIIESEEEVEQNAVKIILDADMEDFDAGELLKTQLIERDIQLTGVSTN
jgi:hypothetical protein